MQMPVLSYIEQNVQLKQMTRSVNAILVIDILLLSLVVIYSLMLSDVNE